MTTEAPPAPAEILGSRAELAGKIAVITGAGTGIGEAIAHAFVREGASVLVVGNPAQAVESVAAELRAQGGDAHAFAGDLSDDKVAAAAISAAIGRWGGLDILVNNASVFGSAGPLETFPIDAFDDVFRLNVRSAFLVTRAALPTLQSRRGKSAMVTPNQLVSRANACAGTYRK
jgi:NAD(P)-dependent dehydrogenase (short-subunit alcohol dehydrogenase family)